MLFAVIFVINPTYGLSSDFEIDKEIVIPADAAVKSKGSFDYYDPPQVSVGIDATVGWINKDNVGHTVTSGNPRSGPDGYFDSGIFLGGEKFVLTFSKGGEYSYFCQIHPWMVGTVDVSSDSRIPAWIKNNAGWWANGQINDREFVQGIQYLIREKIMIVPDTSKNSSSDDIPSWVRNSAGWWADDQIDDDTFIQGIQYLVTIGIIQISTVDSK